MIKAKRSLNDVKREINSFSGKSVTVKVDLGRNKSVKYTGILSGIYPSLFTVSPDDKNFLGKTSYSYADVLCGSVKLNSVK